MQEVKETLENLLSSIKKGFVTVIVALIALIIMQLVVFPFGIKAVAGAFGYDIGYWVALGGYVLARIVVTPTNTISGALNKLTLDMENARKYINKEFNL